MPAMIWDDLRVFLAVHRSGSHKRAGRMLGVAPTTVGRRIAALESALGVRVFLRTPERLQITAAGSKLVAHAERMEAQASDLERELSAADSRLEGSLRITAGDALVQYVLLPKLAELRREHPQLVFELRADTRMLDLSRREADVAVRLVRPKEPALIARRLGDMPMSLQPLLHDAGIDTIIVAGLMTHLAVSLTAADGTLLGYRVIVAADATASRDLPAASGARAISHEVVHQAALAALADRFADVMTAGAVRALPLDP
jgi:DNA-binding transcriptional LysR family regulator